jgi:Putative auto-transporter adhesin, head GIN domain
MMTAHPTPPRFQALLRLGATAIVAVASIGGAHAAPATLDLTGFEGRVRLALSSTDELRSNTDGWQLVQRQNVLLLQQRQDSTPVDHACGGSPARTSTSATNATSARSSVVDIAIPASTRLLARSFGGTLESSVALADARLEVASGGTLRLAQLVGGDVKAVGTGRATIGEAAGSLSLAVNGPGSIQVQGGRTEQLTASLQGSGLIHHGGVVRRATLTAGGDGEIRVRQVQEPPRSEQTGGASITTGCIGLTCER